LSLSAWAQADQSLSEESAFEAEQLMIHTDRQLYISGEIIWFKVMSFRWEMDQLSDFSKVAYLDLISPEGIAVSRVKINLEEGRGNGSIELPQALNSGNYHLRAYTQAMRNGDEEDFAVVKLIILNPGQAVVRADPNKPDTYTRFEPQSPTRPVSSNQVMDIQVKPVQQTVGQRREAVLEITTTDANGRPVVADLSLSVALQTSEKTVAQPLFVETETLSPFDPWRPAKMNYQAENRGMYLRGRVIDEATQDGAPNATIFLAFPGETAMVYLEETDENGEFSFLLPELYGLRQVVLQTHPEETRSLRMELASAFHTPPSLDRETFILPPDWVPLANAALVNAQVQQSYQSFELPPVFDQRSYFDTLPFFGHPEVRYVLDDYSRFPIPEFFFEIVIEVAVKGKYGSERLEVINEWESPFDNPDPLFLVDGVPVFDQRAFLKINNKLIEAAEVVTEPFWLNPIFYNGVIQLLSFEKDGRCFRLPENALQRSFLTLLPERQFSIPDYASQTDSRLPDFRNTLYWNPSVQTDENGKATVRFFTADSVGDFEIHVEGIATEGQLGSAVGIIEVVKEVK
jgi:hypothetical protein